MKKIFALIITAMICVSAFAGEAWKNYLGFGWRLPTSTTMHVQKSGYDNLKMTQSGLDLGYTGVLMSNGFSVRALIDLNFSTSNIDITDTDSELSTFPGLNMTYLIGAGWAPIRNDHFFFGFYGMLGFDFSVFAYDTSWFSSSISKKDAYAYFAFLPAVNATFVWTPVKTFSLFATATVGYACPTFILHETKTNGSDSTDSYLTTGGAKVIPTIGICWKF